LVSSLLLPSSSRLVLSPSLCLHWGDLVITYYHYIELMAMILRRH
jgi:hypothetical protein